MISAHTYGIMAPLVALTASSPGPDVIFITSNALSGRWKLGVAAWGGICCGVFIYVLATAFGLAALFAYLPFLYYIIKWLGIGYLGYIGLLCLRSAIRSQDNMAFRKSVDVGSAQRRFLKGLLVTLLNPKAALFFTAFLPQFVDPAAGAVSTQLLVLGLFAMAVAQPIYILYMVSFVKIGRRIGKDREVRGSGVLQRWADGVCGSLYLTFAAALAFWKRA